MYRTLGKPNGIQHFQKFGLYDYYYLKDNLVIEVDDYVVRMLYLGVPEW
jgi:hypothetical protein